MKLNKLVQRSIKEKRYKRIDIFVTLSLLTLFILSCIMVYSASMIGNKYGIFTGLKPVAPNYFLIRQTMWAILSFSAYLFFAMLVPYEIFKNKKIYTGGLLLIVILLIIPRFQSPINGAYAWIRLGGTTFQPSTLAQIFIITYMALILNARKETLMRPASIKKITNIFIIPITILILIYIQNDTGTMLITTGVVILMIFCSNISFRNLFSLIKIATIGLLFVSFVFLVQSYISGSEASYRINRFKTFLDPFSGNTDSNTHIVNSMIAFGNGGMFGRGLGNSIQKLGYLPEAHTDFIVAILAEELGFIGVLGVITLLLLIIGKVIYTGIKSSNTFDSMIAIGFSGLLFIQTIVNIGGISGSLPMTGVPVPFFSSGGSSMLILSTGLGIIMNMHSHLKYVKGSR